MIWARCVEHGSGSMQFAHTFLSPFTKESCAWTRGRILDSFFCLSSTHLTPPPKHRPPLARNSFLLAGSVLFATSAREAAPAGCNQPFEHAPRQGDGPAPPRRRGGDVTAPGASTLGPCNLLGLRVPLLPGHADDHIPRHAAMCLCSATATRQGRHRIAKILQPVLPGVARWPAWRRRRDFRTVKKTLWLST